MQDTKSKNTKKKDLNLPNHPTSTSCYCCVVTSLFLYFILITFVSSFFCLPTSLFLSFPSFLRVKLKHDVYATSNFHFHLHQHINTHIHTYIYIYTTFVIIIAIKREKKERLPAYALYKVTQMPQSHYVYWENVLLRHLALAHFCVLVNDKNRGSVE